MLKLQSLVAASFHRDVPLPAGKESHLKSGASRVPTAEVAGSSVGPPENLLVLKSLALAGNYSILKALVVHYSKEPAANADRTGKLSRALALFCKLHADNHLRR
jgi:hypothetical protein